jgi:glycosyltransferase involved in cell wall biosynthesis
MTILDSKHQGQSASRAAELLVVMPVFNEQASVRKVVQEWFDEVENWTEDFTFLAIDDGSLDGTLRILNRIKERRGERFEVISRENRGHGQTCLEGYRIAASRGIPYVMQIDSDGQCDPQYFFKLWRKREHYDVIYGVRKRRDDGWRRVVASRVLQLVILASSGVWCEDANVPYRLMSSSKILPAVERIPQGFFLSNIALAVLLKRSSSIVQGTVPIHFRERYGGEPSVPLSRFGLRARELISQLRALES